MISAYGGPVRGACGLGRDRMHKFDGKVASSRESERGQSERGHKTSRMEINIFQIVWKLEHGAACANVLALGG